MIWHGEKDIRTILKKNLGANIVTIHQLPQFLLIMSNHQNSPLTQR